MPSIELIKKLDALDAPLKYALYDLIGEVEKNREEAVTKREFNELNNTVSDLAVKMGELSIAQKELIEAQKQTDIAVKELTEAQKQTDIILKELAEAQKKTEASLQRQEKEHEKTRKQVGGLEKNVAFRLEDMSYRALPDLLEKDYGLIVKGEIKRDFLKNKKGEDVEVNITGRGYKDGKEYLIVGESKCHLSGNDINHFIKSRLKPFKEVYGEDIFPLLITYMVTSPSVRDYAKTEGLALYYSYQF